MEDLFVKYNTAQKLRDLGFNKPCIAFWNHYREVHLNVTYDMAHYHLKAPLIQQVNDWILEEFGINITLHKSIPTIMMKMQDSEQKIPKPRWFYKIEDTKSNFTLPTAPVSETRQKCLELAIDYFIYEKFKEKKLTNY